MLTAEKAILKMSQAKQSVAHAKGLILEALGGTDVGEEYKEVFDDLLQAIEDDTDDIASGEVYEFRS